MKYNKEEIREKFKDLFENSLDLIYVNDLKGNILDANEIALKSLGYKREEIPDLSFIDLVDKENLLKAIKVTKEIVEIGKQTERSEYKLRKKDGKFIYVETYAIPLKKNDKIYAILGIGTNITERKIAEQKLRESEEKYRHLFENSPYFVGLVDLKGNLIDCNDRAEHFLSIHKKEDLIGKNFREIFSINENNKYIIPTFEEIYKNILKGEIPEPIEFKLYRTVGEFLWLNLRGSLIDIEGKKSIQFIIQDITDKKEAEQKLKESEEKYRILFEDSPFSLVLLNFKGKIIDCNPATEMLGGYRKEELIGKDFKNLGILHPNFVPSLIDLFERFVKGEEMHRIDIEIFKKDGDLIWVSLQASIVRLGEKAFVQVIMHDITKRKQADLLIKEEVNKLKELDQIRKDLISRVSHELKTPLVSVVGGSELLLNNFKEKMMIEELELLEIIQKGGKRLKYLVDNLLDISRIESNKFKLEKKEDDLSEIIKEISNDMKYLIRERKLILNIEQPDSLGIKVDRIRIEQVITNLLLNAIKNSPPMGNITIKLQKKEDWAEISINDTGVGLTKEEMNIIFTRFGKIERYGQGLEYIDIQGSGLGLFISKEIVDLHGGYIRAESEGRNKGSTFIVKLPIQNRHK